MSCSRHGSKPNVRTVKSSQELDPEDRPWLRSDPTKSSPDRITVAIQAENFKSIWCESLGRRLGEGVPFLWQLETGEMLGSASPVEWDDTFVAVPRKTITLDDGVKTIVEPFEIAPILSRTSSSSPLSPRPIT